MLLGAFIESGGKTLALDIGSGSGVLSLMLAQKNPNLLIHSLELDENSYLELQFNIDNSKYHKQISCYHDDIVKYDYDTKYDLIFSNPPFYLSNNPNTQENEMQKHNSLESLRTWFQKINHLISPLGDLWLIYPNKESHDFERLLHEEGFSIHKRIRLINAHKNPIRIISNLRKGKDSSFSQSEFQIRNREGAYTQEYKDLTIDFHNRIL